MYYKKNRTPNPNLILEEQPLEVDEPPPLVPPLNFSLVEPGLYRSGYPNDKNFVFLKKLQINTMIYITNMKGYSRNRMSYFFYKHPKKVSNNPTHIYSSYLGSRPYDPKILKFVEEENIRVFYFDVKNNKEPFSVIDLDQVRAALEPTLDSRLYPLLIHCHKGKYRVGCLIGCLRKLQGWALSSIFDEYSRFAGANFRISDQESIEEFEEIVSYDREHKPFWLQ